MPEKKTFPSESPEAQKKEKIRDLNDMLRRTSMGGKINLTQGVWALGRQNVNEIMWAVQQFNTFTPDNDPHQEHDFGVVEVNGKRIFWKIDYYDQTFTYHSPDPSDPSVTNRVMTVMLAEEY